MKIRELPLISYHYQISNLLDISPMSKKWTKTPQPLVLRREPRSRENFAETSRTKSSPTDDPLNASPLHPPNRIHNAGGSSPISTSSAQWVTTGPPTEYGDLHSAVPFQNSSGMFTPALPSAEFPMSVKGYATTSPPGTSTHAEFPTPPETEGAYSYYYGSQSSRASVDSAMVEPPTAVTYQLATAVSLNRANSNLSYNSLWSGDGSDQHFSLDIAQFPQPPGAQASSSSSASISGSQSSSSHRRLYSRSQPIPSPLYEETEPSHSRPLTPASGASTAQHGSKKEGEVATEVSHRTEPEGFGIHTPMMKKLLVPPSPDPMSSRASFQSHATMASRGSSIYQFSVEAESRRQSAMGEEGAAAWEDIMKAVRPGWTPGTSEAKPAAPSSISDHAVIGGTTLESSGHGLSTRDRLNVAMSFLTPSAESSSDIYSAVGRMNFPSPPSDPIPPHSYPASPTPSTLSLGGGSRSPWITGITLKTKPQTLSRRSSSASTKKRLEDFPASPKSSTVPPLPTTAKDLMNVPSSIIVTPSADARAPIGAGDSFWGSSERSASPKSGLGPPIESTRQSNSSGM